MRRNTVPCDRAVYTAVVHRPNALNVKYVATLAVVAAVILVVGSLARPRVHRPEQAPPSETDLARLGRLTERRTLDSAGAFLTQVADDVAPSIVWLDQPGVSGIVWAASTIAAARFDASAAAPGVMTAGGEVAAAHSDWSPDLPVARVDTAAPLAAPPVRRGEPPAQSGAPVIAVWRTPQGRVFAPATFIDRTAASCGDLPSREVRATLVVTRAMAGGGLFDLDGGLLGVILPCGDRYAVVVPDVIDDLLLKVASFEHRLVARYGVVAEPLTNDESAYFKVVSGVMVRELRIGGPAATAGLEAGDIIVGLTGAPVGRMDDLQSLAAPDPVPVPVFSIRRESAALDVTLGDAHDAPAPHDEGSSGITWESPHEGFLVGAVRPGSRAAVAGLHRGDRVIRLGNGLPRTLDQMRRALEAGTGTAVFVVYERAGRQRGTLVAREGR